MVFDIRPDEGIDKISVIINPLFLNKDCKKRHIFPDNRLTLHKAGPFTVLAIHQEYFNPLLDYQMQISFAVYELIKIGLINFPDTIMTPYFIYKNHSWFILRIVALEFYSSWANDEIIIDDDMVETNLETAIVNDCLYRYVVKSTGEITNTYYSNDKSTSKYNRSSFIIYDKQKKDIHDNRLPKEVILANTKPIRSEFRLYAENTPWLHWDNLQGDYNTIFKRHKRQLAVIYNNYVRECITVSSKVNENFNKVVKCAEKINPVRSNSKRLRQRVPIATIMDRGIGNEIVIRQTVVDKMDRFSVKSGNREKAQEMREMMGEKAIKGLGE